VLANTEVQKFSSKGHLPVRAREDIHLCDHTAVQITPEIDSAFSPEPTHLQSTTHFSAFVLEELDDCREQDHSVFPHAMEKPSMSSLMTCLALLWVVESGRGRFQGRIIAALGRLRMGRSQSKDMARRHADPGNRWSQAPILGSPG